MVPADAPLEAEVRIEPPDVGLLRIGDPARIRLEAFPFQRNGTLTARLRTISEDTFARKGGDQSGGGQAYYVARLDIESSQLRAVPADNRLLPGLTLSSAIVVGHRTVLSYFLYLSTTHDVTSCGRDCYPADKASSRTHPGAGSAGLAAAQRRPETGTRFGGMAPEQYIGPRFPEAGNSI